MTLEIINGAPPVKEVATQAIQPIAGFVADTLGNLAHLPNTALEKMANITEFAHQGLKLIEQTGKSLTAPILSTINTIATLPDQVLNNILTIAEQNPNLAQTLQSGILLERSLQKTLLSGNMIINPVKGLFTGLEFGFGLALINLNSDPFKFISSGLGVGLVAGIGAEISNQSAHTNINIPLIFDDLVPDATFFATLGMGAFGVLASLRPHNISGTDTIQTYANAGFVFGALFDLWENNAGYDYTLPWAVNRLFDAASSAGDLIN